MHTAIHPDQTGFITGRQLFGNIRRLFNVLYSPEKSPTAEVLLSLDAHKAFDRIEYVSFCNSGEVWFWIGFLFLDKGPVC